MLLAQYNQVVVLDIQPERVALLNQKQSPLADAGITEYLAKVALNFTATLGLQEAYQGADFVIIATPTDYDPLTNQFNTSSVELVIKDVITINPDAVIIIKSTVPVGFTEQVKRKFGTENIIFRLSFYEKAKPFTIIYTHHAFLLVRKVSVQRFLPGCFSRVRSSKMCQSCFLTARKLKR